MGSNSFRLELRPCRRRPDNFRLDTWRENAAHGRRPRRPRPASPDAGRGARRRSRASRASASASPASTPRPCAPWRRTHSACRDQFGRRFTGARAEAVLGAFRSTSSPDTRKRGSSTYGVAHVLLADASAATRRRRSAAARTEFIIGRGLDACASRKSRCSSGCVSVSRDASSPNGQLSADAFRGGRRHARAEVERIVRASSAAAHWQRRLRLFRHRARARGNPRAERTVDRAASRREGLVNPPPQAAGRRRATCGSQACRA